MKGRGFAFDEIEYSLTVCTTVCVRVLKLEVVEMASIEWQMLHEGTGERHFGNDRTRKYTPKMASNLACEGMLAAIRVS